MRIEIETLDTGLLKGHSYADPAEGWGVESISVAAVDHRGASWPVIEIPEASRNGETVLFFEVTIQEIPRGEQLEVSTTVTFSDGTGATVQRTAMDRWPP